MRQLGVIIEDLLRTVEVAILASIRDSLTGSFIVLGRPNATNLSCFLPPHHEGKRKDHQTRGETGIERLTARSTYTPAKWY